MDNCSAKLGNDTYLKSLLTDPLPKIPQALFWDTSLPASAILMHPESSRKKTVIAFLGRLIKEKTVIAFSSVLFDEFVHISIRNELKKAQLSLSQINRILQNNEKKYIEPHIPDIQRNITALRDIMNKFNGRLTIINPLESGIITKALELRIKYKLGHCDSIHLATMLYGSHRDIACFDRKDFGIVNGLNLWCKI